MSKDNDGVFKYMHPKEGTVVTEGKRFKQSESSKIIEQYFNNRDKRYYSIHLGLKNLIMEVEKKKTDLIMETLKKAGVDIEDIESLAKDSAMEIMPGLEVLKYKGHPIIEFYPPTFPLLEHKDGAFTSSLNFSYRILR